MSEVYVTKLIYSDCVTVGTASCSCVLVKHLGSVFSFNKIKMYLKYYFPTDRSIAANRLYILVIYLFMTRVTNVAA